MFPFHILSLFPYFNIQLFVYILQTLLLRPSPSLPTVWVATLVTNAARSSNIPAHCNIIGIFTAAPIGKSNY